MERDEALAEVERVIAEGEFRSAERIRGLRTRSIETMEGLGTDRSGGKNEIAERKRELRRSMIEARREVAALLVAVADPSLYDDRAEISFPDWEMATVTQTEKWTAISFRGSRATDQQKFDRDLTVAVRTGRMTCVMKEKPNAVATPEHPALVPAETTVRFCPSSNTGGILIFSPPILDQNGRRN